jgi:hypothetical protein
MTAEVSKLERRWNAGEEATQAAYERLVLQLREQLQHIATSHSTIM